MRKSFDILSPSLFSRKGVLQLSFFFYLKANKLIEGEQLLVQAEQL